ncbi:hypothetical protein GCM10023078_37750 [Gibbsiella greigii]
MTVTEKKGLSPRRDKLRHRAKRILQLLGTLVAMMAIALVVAHWGVNHPNDSTALREWMQRTRYSWLAWRLALYAALVWGFWKVWHAPGCKPAYKGPLKRMALACTVFALVCEYTIFGGGLPL